MCDLEQVGLLLGPQLPSSSSDWAVPCLLPLPYWPVRPDPLLRTLIPTTGRHPVTGLEKRINQAVPLLKAMGRRKKIANASPCSIFTPQIIHVCVSHFCLTCHDLNVYSPSDTRIPTSSRCLARLWPGTLSFPLQLAGEADWGLLGCGCLGSILHSSSYSVC